MMKVLVIQQVMKQYRLPFFLRLHDDLLKHDIRLTVAYSDPNDAHSLRKDNVKLPESFGFKVKGYWFFNRLLYQPLWKQITEADLVIVGPEIKYLINPMLLLMSALRLKKVAFWGLGPNRHPDRSPAAEWVKEFIFTKVDWWFAYTATIAEYLRKRGMLESRITTVQNATDTSGQRRFILEILDEEVAREKLTLTGVRDSRIGLYCGMMHSIKDLPFLIETARRVKEQCSAFHLILIGDGPQRPWLESEIAGESWIHFLGPKFGQETALYFKMADVFLIGGTAGLAVVDSFAAGLPPLATQLPTHPPEISYIRDGENGRIVPHDAAAFAECIVETISNSAMLSRLRAGAWESGAHYTLETMVDNFSNGIKSCLVASGHTSFTDSSRSTTQPIEY